jgi:hypothetical protein
MYPIHCPVAAFPGTLLNLGVLDRSLSMALNAFGYHPAGLAVPLITADWDRISGINLGSAETSTVIASLRRLSDAGDMLAAYHREIESRHARESSSKISQHGFETHQIDQSRLAELAGRAGPRKSDFPPKSRWLLGTAPRDQGQAFLNGDGRGIHLKSVGADRAVLGYGWHSGIMHYLEISAAYPTGRSVALFSAAEMRASDFSPPLFASLVQSLLEFYSGALEDPGPKVVVSGTDMKHNAVAAEGSAEDAAFLNRTYRSLSLSHDFAVETHRLVDGSRNPTFRGITPGVPQAQFRYIAAENRVVTSLYRSAKSETVGEVGLSPEQRGRLSFPRPASSRPPSRP